MIRLKEFTQGVFKEEHDQNGYEDIENKDSKIFSDRDGLGWKILRCLLSILFVLCHLILSIVFLSFFMSSIAFTITVVLDMVFEMLTPPANTQSKKHLLSVCFFFLLCSIIVLSCLMLSLFWQVLKVVLMKTAPPFDLARCAFLLVALAVSGIWAGAEKGVVSFVEYNSYVACTSWIQAFIVSIVGSILMLVFMYTESINSKPFLILHSVVCVLFLLFSLICPISFSYASVFPSSFSTAFAFCVPFLTAIVIIYSYYKGKCGSVYNPEQNTKFMFHRGICLAFVGFILFSLVLFTSIMNAPTDCTTNCQRTSKHHNMAYDIIPPSNTQYHICTKKWTNDDLNIADLAFIANLTYHNAVLDRNKTAVQKLCSEHFANRSMTWQVRFLSENSPLYVDLRVGNNSIIAVKGSKTLIEFMESAKLWDESTVLQVISLFVPLLNELPTDFIAQYVAQTSFINKIFHDGTNDYFFQGLENYVQGIKNDKHIKNVVLVGHSLGGGIAKIIGARKQIPAVSFSSPGIAYGYRKFGFSLDDAAKFSVSVSPSGDIIPLLDKHIGLQQTIDCKADTFVKCHLMGTTFCELHHGCGMPVSGCDGVLGRVN